jgi:hypothetical protein
VGVAWVSFRDDHGGRGLALHDRGLCAFSQEMRAKFIANFVLGDLLIW